MNLKETMLHAAESFEHSARESAKMAADPKASQYWRDYDAAQAKRLGEEAAFYRAWAEREGQGNG